ncbi:MAG: nicotinate-nicotinamide nucleotide adenylyltransferase [Candidatus Saccharimonadales bacterium]
MSRPRRIGIYSGTFNPVHSGHVTFALQALQAANLDQVYFLPERRPRYKQHVEHYGHRVAMIRHALKLHPKLEVLETDDVSFTVSRTLPRLEFQFPDAQMVFLMGSDVLTQLHTWPEAHRLLQRSELAIGLRSDVSWHDVRLRLSALPIHHDQVHIVESFAPDVSSKQVRQGLRERRYVHGLLSSVAHYSNRNWLYVSLS